MAYKQLWVVDTSAWIEWLTDSQHGKKLNNRFPAKNFCIVPTIVQLELSKWLTRELGEERADTVIANKTGCMKLFLDLNDITYITAFDNCGWFRSENWTA
jgi:uncharacterized protein with PIN domain